MDATVKTLHPSLSLQQRVAAYEIDGHRMDAGSPGFDRAIAWAHEEGLRPRCLCRPGGVEMYVSRLGHGYLVKRMPDTGAQHAASCPSFEPSADASGLKQLIGSAIVEDPASGTTALRLDVSLSVSGSRAMASHPPTAQGVAKKRPTRMSLRALLHYLWDQAELTRWHPGFAGKRSWSMVRRHILGAAEQNLANGDALLPKLYMPEPFLAEQKDQIETRRRAIWARAATQPSGRQQLLLLVGEVKEIQPGRHGFKAVIKHVPDIAFGMEEGLFRSVERRFADGLALWNASDDVRMIAIAAFGVTKHGLPTIVSLYLMTVTRDWLPVESAAEWQLVSHLIDDQRAFCKLLRYDALPDECIASVALTDQGEHVRLLSVDGDEMENPASGDAKTHEKGR